MDRIDESFPGKSSKLLIFKLNRYSTYSKNIILQIDWDYFKKTSKIIKGKNFPFCFKQSNFPVKRFVSVPLFTLKSTREQMPIDSFWPC